MSIKESPFFTVPITTCGIAPIISKTTNPNSPTCMTFQFGRLHGHVYCVFKHSPEAKYLPDGTEFGWTYDLKIKIGDGEELPLYAMHQIDIEKLTTKGE